MGNNPDFYFYNHGGRPVCPYSNKCKILIPDHIENFVHPINLDYTPVSNTPYISNIQLDKPPPIKVTEEYEIKNGILGMKRDIYCRLTDKMGYGKEKIIKNVFVIYNFYFVLYY
jgi:hypothetical protein